MKRYLLFDSRCSVCDQIAQAIEEAAAGKLEAVSIHDARAREWLDQAYPGGWEHRPYLVTVEGDRVKASAGTGMALRLGLLLGPPQGVADRAVSAPVRRAAERCGLGTTQAAATRWCTIGRADAVRVAKTGPVEWAVRKPQPKPGTAAR